MICFPKCQETGQTERSYTVRKKCEDGTRQSVNLLTPNARLVISD